MSDHEGGKGESPSVLGTIRALHAGTVKGRSLSVEDRQRLVEHLTIEGYSTADTAEILGLSERTIERDRRAVRHANALRSDPTFIRETIGQLVMQADASAGRLKRLARERTASPMARIEAEYAAWRVQRELIALLQRLGYLPMASVKADVHCRITSEPLDDLTPSFEELGAEIERLMKLREGPADDDDRMHALRQKVTLLTLASHLQQVAAGSQN